MDFCFFFICFRIVRKSYVLCNDLVRVKYDRLQIEPVYRSMGDSKEWSCSLPERPSEWNGRQTCSHSVGRCVLENLFVKKQTLSEMRIRQGLFGI